MRIFILLLTYLFALEIPNEFHSKFIQTISSNDKNLTYKGEIYFKNQELVWKYSYPENKIIWIKDKVYIYEPDLLQVTIAKRDITLKDILKNSKKIKDNLYKADIKGKSYYFIYTTYLKKLYFKDEMDNLIEIDFSPPTPIKDDSIFKISYPQDVDILYTTK